jgi:hypothetical protein
MGIPYSIEALLDGPITGETLATIRTYYANPPVAATAIDELLAISERVGNSGGPELKAFISEKLADLLVQDFDPLRRR